jgi:RNA polymerase sigma-70 factor (ECF subfamily)
MLNRRSRADRARSYGSSRIHDTLLEGSIDTPLGPGAPYETTEAVCLAFVTALQLLPPGQLAVRILRDVL